MAKFKVKGLKVKLAKVAKSNASKKRPTSGKGNEWAKYIGGRSGRYVPSGTIPD